MTARELVKKKNLFIATQQISHSNKSQADAIRWPTPGTKHVVVEWLYA